MFAFCTPTALPPILRLRRGPASRLTRRGGRRSVVVAKKSSSSSKSARSKSDANSGFSPRQNDSSTQKQRSEPPPVSESVASENTKSGVDLQSVDGRGISLEHRLREEIKHPLRKPKQTLFATLSFSALLASFIAISRLISHQDSIQQFSINLLINMTGVSTFAYLTWRQVQFGRRALNSIAGRPQLRDLPIAPPSSSSSPSLPSWLRSSRRMSSIIRRSDVMVLIGRRTQLEAYLYRCKQISDVFPFSMVLFPTDIQSLEAQYPIQPDALAERDNEAGVDWNAWLADVLPSRRNIAVLRISRNDQATQPATAYLVQDGDAKSISLPPG